MTRAMGHSPNGQSLADLLDNDPELIAAAYAPVNFLIDELWAGHERYMRERYADVYELGSRLIREREVSRQLGKEGGK